MKYYVLINLSTCLINKNFIFTNKSKKGAKDLYYNTSNNNVFFQILKYFHFYLFLYFYQNKKENK